MVEIFTLMGQAYKMQYSEPWVYFFSRDQSGNPVKHVLKQHRPHYSISLGSTPQGYPEDHENISLYMDMITGEKEYFLKYDHNIDPDYVNPGRTKEFRLSHEEQGYTHYEANITFPERTMIDLGIFDKYYLDSNNNNKIVPIRPWLFPGEKPDDPKLFKQAQQLVIRPRCCIFDIEIDNKDGGDFPSWSHPVFPVQSIQFIDSYEADIVRVYWVRSKGEIPGTTQIEREGKKFQVVTTFFKSDKELLQAFVAYAERVRFDHYYAHFGNEFDLPYLYGRMEHMGVDISGLSPLRRVYMRKELLSDGFRAGDKGKAGQTSSAQPVVISGCSAMDTIPVIKKYTYQKKEPGYSLKILIGKNFGEGYYEGLQDYGRRFGWALQNDPLGAWKYSCLDTIGLFLLITRVYPIIIQYDNYRRIAGVAAHDSLANNKFIKFLKIRMRKMLGRPPMRTNSMWMEGDPKVPGAFVIPPVTGITDWTAAIDFGAMYPTIIESDNMGSECLIPERFAIDMGIPYIKSYDGICFRTDVVSINSLIVQIVKTYRREAKDLKKKYLSLGKEELAKTYDDIQLAFKLLGVSIYGDAVYRFSSDYNYDVGRAITGRGRELLMALKSFYTSEHDLITIAGDTDSTFVKLRESRFIIQDSLDTGKLYSYVLDLERSANKWFVEFAKQNNHRIPMQVEAEKIIKRIVFKERTLTIKRERELLNLLQSLRDAEAYGHTEEIPLIQEKIHEIEIEKSVKKQYIYHSIAVKDDKGNFIPQDKIIEMGSAGKRTDTAAIIRKIIAQAGEKLMRDTVSNTMRYIRSEFKKAEIFNLDDVAQTKGFNKHPKFYKTHNVFTNGSRYAEKHFNQRVDTSIKPKLIYIKKIQGKFSERFPDSVVCYDGIIRPLKAVVTLTESFADIPQEFWEHWQVDWKTQREKIFSPLELLIKGIGENWDMLISGQKTLSSWL